jgi:hypothetical protein
VFKQRDREGDSGLSRRQARRVALAAVELDENSECGTSLFKRRSAASRRLDGARDRQRILRNSGKQEEELGGQNPLMRSSFVVDLQFLRSNSGPQFLDS